MVFWKAWFDVRQRFFLILILWVVLIGETRVQAAVNSVQAAEAALALEGDASSDLQFRSYGYSRLVGDWVSGQANGTLSIIVILLAVGGVLGRASGRPDLMTMGLPSSRASWLWAQAGLAAVLLFFLAVQESLLVIVTAWGFGLEVSEGPILLASLLTTLSAVIWIWPTILAMVLLRDSTRAATLTIAVMVGAALPGVVGEANRPFFRDLADVTLWQGSIPWLPLLAGAALTAVTAWAALARFERMEL